MKRLLSLLLALMMLLSLGACSAESVDLALDALEAAQSMASESAEPDSLPDLSVPDQQAPAQTAQEEITVAEPAQEAEALAQEAEVLAQEAQALAQEAEASNLEAEQASAQETEPSALDEQAPIQNADPVPEPASEAPPPTQEIKEAPAQNEEPTLPEDGVYDSKDEVALYIHLYGHLPDNYITKSQAQDLGWTGGSLEPYAPGKCIGGSYFGNYEGLLPTVPGRRYTECDIDTLGASSRGAKRIVFSNDGLIYYTDDHYDSFTLLAGEP